MLQTQEKRIGNEKGFNGQTRLKSGYSNFLGKMRQFPENLVPYTELTMDDYRTGVAQKRKKALLAQLELLKVAAVDVNLEVDKYITMVNLRPSTSFTGMIWVYFGLFFQLWGSRSAILLIGRITRNKPKSFP